MNTQIKLLDVVALLEDQPNWGYVGSWGRLLREYEPEF